MMTCPDCKGHGSVVGDVRDGYKFSFCFRCHGLGVTSSDFLGKCMIDWKFIHHKREELQCQIK